MKKTKKFNKPSDFQVKRFTAHNWERVYALAGCGALCLATILNENPYKIQEENKCENHYSDDFILKKLKKHNYKILPLTNHNIVKFRNNDGPFEDIIKENMVILTSQQLTKDQASWFVHYGQYSWHLGEIIKQRQFDFFQFPVLTAYLITHQKYDR